MTPLDNAKRLVLEASVAVAEAQQAVRDAKDRQDWPAYDAALERERLARELRLVRLAQRQVAEIHTRREEGKRAS